MIRLLFKLLLLAAFIYFGSTVNLGSKTFFGHVQAIWQSDETQELVEDIKEKSKPALEKSRRVIKAGWEEISNVKKDDNVPAQKSDAGIRSGE